eukprot:TRINITY_DN69556_c0_g1_i1.p1 TRINITY_DN69556_c0_g1~~TRINITY_DN69556_c0_g1_i1.p1  ORF type:complete len:586 (+),score=76.23 TRINITY_DN69556_c0_g1_i1:71-1828(+)
MFCDKTWDNEDDDEDVSEVSTKGLSVYGKALVEELTEECPEQYRHNWNVSLGTICGEIMQTPPRHSWGTRDVPAGASNCLPCTIRGIIGRAQHWVDVSSLSPPDGLFLEELANAMLDLHNTGQEITVRFLFGNLPGMPVDCDGVCLALSKHLPQGTKKRLSNLSIWVGSYRAGPTSWNHSKIIAVDGIYLMTGGHNLWHPHYLEAAPVHDISIVVEGPVALDGHHFVDKIWLYMGTAISHDLITRILLYAPDWMPTVSVSRICLGHYPLTSDMDEMPPLFRDEGEIIERPLQNSIPIISMGRYGAINDENGSDTGIITLLSSAQSIIRMSLQDLGPLMLPGSNSAIPGGVWPAEYLNELAIGLLERNITVEIVLSAPHAVPGTCSPLVANYGNGWSCVDVAAEILKAMQNHRRENHGDEPQEAHLRGILEDQLRISHIRTQAGCDKFSSGQEIGNHAKFFVVDDSCFYIGSQNLYICNLAEWGLVIDHHGATQKVLQEYWAPLWENSYTPADCPVEDVMKGLKVDRNGKKAMFATRKERLLMAQERRKWYKAPAQSSFHEDDTHEAASLHGILSHHVDKHFHVSR